MVTLYVLIALVNNVHSSCGYVDLSASIDLSGLSVPVGEFTLSLNECQSLWIPVLEVAGQEQSVYGGIKFHCDAANSSRLIVDEYNDPLCTYNKQVSSSTIPLNEKIKLFNQHLFFTLTSFVCPDTDCSIEVTFADDCRGTNSEGYSHLATPLNSCQTFGHDFGHDLGQGTIYSGLLSNVAYEIWPQGTVNGLFSTALVFNCCDDHSLLIYNYSDVNCDSQTEYNTLRLPHEYNGQCFVLYNEQRPFDASHNKANTNDVNFEEGVFALRYSWNCDEYIDCDGIPFMDESQIPNVCPDQCLMPGYTSPTAAPTFHPISDGGYVTVAAHNVQSETHSVTGITGFVLFGIAIFLVAMIAVVIGYCVYNKRKLNRAVEESKQKQITKKDSRYEPMISTEIGKDINANEIMNENDTLTGQYVLPGKVTDQPDDGEEGNTNDNANLLAGGEQ